MLPFLKYLSDKKVHSLSETHDALAIEFKLTDDELRELLPSAYSSPSRTPHEVFWKAARGALAI